MVRVKYGGIANNLLGVLSCLSDIVSRFELCEQPGIDISEYSLVGPVTQERTISTRSSRVPLGSAAQRSGDVEDERNDYNGKYR